MDSKTLFVKLKETCRKIDSDVNNIKMKMIATHENHNQEEVVSKKICEIQDKINIMKSEACDLKSMLEPKLVHTKNFIKNLKELIAETEVSVSIKEEYLKQYGYIPVESVPQVPEIIIENRATPLKKIREDLPATPNLLINYGLSSCNLTKTPELNQKSLLENSPVPPASETVKLVQFRSTCDSTPTLDVTDVVSSSNPKETPPLPEPCLYTPAKETPPMPGAVIYDSAIFPSTPKLNI